MNYLYEKRQGSAMNNDWMALFDVIIVGGNKPAFLTDEGRLPLLRVEAHTGKLENIDSMPDASEVPAFMAMGKCFQGGNAPRLHHLLQLTSGDRLLYVGDHIYADVMRSKRVLGWRYLPPLWTRAPTIIHMFLFKHLFIYLFITYI